MELRAISNPAAATVAADRRNMLAANLNTLLSSMNGLKQTEKGSDPLALRHLREGAELAVKLADLIAREHARSTPP